MIRYDKIWVKIGWPISNGKKSLPRIVGCVSFQGFGPGAPQKSILVFSLIPSKQSPSPIIPSLISPINLPKSHPSSHQAIKPSSHRQVRLRLQLRCPGAAAVLPRLGGLRTRPGAPALAAEWCSRTGMVGWWGGGMAIEIRRVYVNFHWFILMYRKYVRKWLVDIFEYIWYWYEMNGC